MATLELALQWYQKRLTTIRKIRLHHTRSTAQFGHSTISAAKTSWKPSHASSLRKTKTITSSTSSPLRFNSRFADIKRTEFKQYIEAAEEYAKLWDYRPLPKFHLVKLMGKFFEGRSYYEAAKPEGYQEGDADANFNADYLQQSVSAYQEAVAMFNDEAFLPGVAQERYDDFSERVAQVEACIMNEALPMKCSVTGRKHATATHLFLTRVNTTNAPLLLVANSHVKEGDKEGAINYYNSILDKLADADNRSLAEIKLADLLRQRNALKKQLPSTKPWSMGIRRVNTQTMHSTSSDFAITKPLLKIPALLESSEAAFKSVISDYADSPNAVEALLPAWHSPIAMRHKSRVIPKNGPSSCNSPMKRAINMDPVTMNSFSDTRTYRLD